MHIALIILRIIGIIILVLLCLILLCLLILMLVPVRYSIAAKADGSKGYLASGKAGWLFSIFKVFFTIDPDGLRYSLKLFGKKIAGNYSDQEKTVSGEDKERPEITGSEPPDLDQAGDSEDNEIKGEPKVIESPPEPEDRLGDAESSEIKEERKETESMPEPEDRSEDSEGPSLLDRLEELIESIPDKISGLLDRIANLGQKINNLTDTLDRYPVDVYISCGLDAAGKVIRHILPKTLKGHVDFGFGDDSCMTGHFLSLASMAYPLYGKSVVITPHFHDVVLKGDFRGKGRIRPGYLVSVLVGLLLKKEIRQLICILLNHRKK